MSKTDPKPAAVNRPGSAASELTTLITDAGAEAPAAPAAETAAIAQPSATPAPKPSAAAAVKPSAKPVDQSVKPFGGKLASARMKLGEHIRNVWVIVPELNVPFDTIANDPAFLSHVASKLRPNDRIEVLPECGSYFAEFIVRAAGRQHCKLALLRRVELEPTRAEADTRFTIVYRGAHLKNTVIRIRDKAVLKDGFDTPEEAASWLASNAKSLAA